MILIEPMHPLSLDEYRPAPTVLGVLSNLSVSLAALVAGATLVWFLFGTFE